MIEIVLVANGIVTDDDGPEIFRLKFNSQHMFHDWLAYGGSLAEEMKRQNNWDKVPNE